MKTFLFQGEYVNFIQQSNEFPRFPEKSGCGYLYAISFPNGRFKVGRSSNPISRAAAHQMNYSCYTGELFSELAVFGPVASIKNRETDLLDFFTAKGFSLVAGNEWFTLDKEIGFATFALGVSVDVQDPDTDLIKRYFNIYRGTGATISYTGFLAFYLAIVKTDVIFSKRVFDEIRG